jgi:uncharacterized membrane protein
MVFTKLDAHYKLLISVLVALLIFWAGQDRLSSPTQFILTWIGFSFVMNALSWLTICLTHPLEMKKIAKVQDSNRTIIFIFSLLAALSCLFVVLILLKTTKSMLGTELNLHILMSVLAVILSWGLVHTLFLFRYAHLYYEDAVQGKPNGKYLEGLEYPDEKEPDYLDFAYFSFVIGMTFQVSDVEISSRRIRRLALLHSLIAFGFNTVIVALSINVISGLVTK